MNASPSEPSADTPDAPAPARAEPTSLPRRLPWNDKVFAVALVVHICFLGTLWGLHMTATVPELKITPFDAVAVPGKKVELSVKFEKDGPGPFNKDLSGTKVVFSLWNGKTLEATTDKEGIGTVTITAPDEPGYFPFLAFPKEADKYVERRERSIDGLYGLHVLAADASVLICDLDGTVTTEDELGAMFEGKGPDPQAGSADLLRVLAEDHEIIFVTARDDSFLNVSRRWLQDKGFPIAPVICRDWRLGSISKTGEYKKAVFDGLKKQFTRIRLGIGNNEGDCNAYQAAGIPHITLEESRCGETPTHTCKVAKDWTEVKALIKGILSAERAADKPAPTGDPEKAEEPEPEEAGKPGPASRPSVEE